MIQNIHLHYSDITPHKHQNNAVCTALIKQNLSFITLALTIIDSVTQVTLPSSSVHEGHERVDVRPTGAAAHDITGRHHGQLLKRRTISSLITYKIISVSASEDAHVEMSTSVLIVTGLMKLSQKSKLTVTTQIATKSIFALHK